MERQTGYALTLLELIQKEPDVAVRMSSAVLFKNFVKTYWGEGEGKENGVTAQDKATIRAGIVGLMCACPANIQRQVSEAVRLIADVDFPENWPTLLPGLIEKLNSQDLVVIVGVLETANSILKRFRYVQKSDALYVKLKYVLETFQEPLLKFFMMCGNMIKGYSSPDPANLKLLFSAHRLSTRIFFLSTGKIFPSTLKII